MPLSAAPSEDWASRPISPRKLTWERVAILPASRPEKLSFPASRLKPQANSADDTNIAGRYKNDQRLENLRRKAVPIKTMTIEVAASLPSQPMISAAVEPAR